MYYIYSLSKQRWVRTTENFIDILRWFIGSDLSQVKKSWDNLNMSGNDRRVIIRYIITEGHYARLEEQELRDYMVFDDQNRIIDPRVHIGNDESSFKLAKIPGSWVHQHLFCSKYDHNQWYLERLVKGGYKYRNGPVPGKGLHNHHWFNYRRYPRTTNEVRANDDPEVREFVRPRRNDANMPDSYQYRVRDRGHCWKDHKLKKQWQKNKPKHCNTRRWRPEWAA